MGGATEALQAGPMQLPVPMAQASENLEFSWRAVQGREGEQNQIV